MKKLIEALQILIKYGDYNWPTHCEHDVLYIVGINPDDVTEEDKNKLHELGFLIGEETGQKLFYSYKYGSS